jgi:hypothetical protein
MSPEVEFRLRLCPNQPMNLYKLIYLCTACWHLLAAYHFTLFPGRSLARISRERPVSPMAIEAVRFLGGINFAFFLLGVGACFVATSSYWLASLTLLFANLSQTLIDISVKNRGLAGGPFFARIFWGDVSFTLLNGLALAWLLFGSVSAVC